MYGSKIDPSRISGDMWSVFAISMSTIDRYLLFAVSIKKYFDGATCAANTSRYDVCFVRRLCDKHFHTNEAHCLSTIMSTAHVAPSKYFLVETPKTELHDLFQTSFEVMSMCSSLCLC